MATHHQPIDPELLRRLADLRLLLESGVIGRLIMQDPVVRADQLRSLVYVLGETTKAAERELRRLGGDNNID